MSWGKSSVKVRALMNQTQEQAEMYIRFLASPTHGVYNVPTKVAKELLLRGLIMYNGQFFKVKAKSVGAGVHEISRVDP